MNQSRTITRKSASNLALAFVLLPPAKRDSMSALYAFCREVDDVADEETAPVAERRARLHEWRQDLQRACRGEAPRLPVIQELQPVIQARHLSANLFEEIIQGVEMDLDISRYATYEPLETYCYRVASAVGLLSIEIFGYRDPACRQYAIHLGQALQLTNILRDVRVDAERNRIYLPQEELRRHGVTEEEILRGEYSPRFRALAEAVGARARGYYTRARETLPPGDRKAMIAAELMGSVYWCLLQKLERAQFQVLGPKLTRLTKAHKIFLIARTWFRLARGSRIPNYGD